MNLWFVAYTLCHLSGIQTATAFEIGDRHSFPRLMFHQMCGFATSNKYDAVLHVCVASKSYFITALADLFCNATHCKTKASPSYTPLSLYGMNLAAFGALRRVQHTTLFALGVVQASPSYTNTAQHAPCKWPFYLCRSTWSATTCSSRLPATSLHPSSTLAPQSMCLSPNGWLNGQSCVGGY